MRPAPRATSAPNVRRGRAERLGARAAGVLRGVVVGHVRTGSPVGSKMALRHAGLSISPATVRVEMGRLTEAGLLAQPHTSAGRVPTPAGYRVYVDQIMRARKPSAQARAELDSALSEAASEPGALVRVASQKLSLTCTLAAIAREPGLEAAQVARIELVWLAPERCLAALLFTDGLVRHGVVRLGRPTERRDLERAQLLFNARWSGHALETVREGLQAQLRAADAEERRLLRVAERAVDESCATEQLTVFGRKQLLDQEDPESLANLMRALEDKQLLLELLDGLEGAAPSVLIGRGEAGGLPGCSVVAARVGAEGAEGVLAIIGPMRINYARVVGWVGYTTATINGMLRDPRAE